MSGVDFGQMLPDLHLDEEDSAERARIDALVAHNPADDVVQLGKLEDLDRVAAEKIAEQTPAPAAGSSTVPVEKNKLALIKKIAQNLKDSTAQLAELLAMAADGEPMPKTNQSLHKASAPKETTEAGGSVVEGIFDGEKMIGPDGQAYDVPVNYASKSRLVEGDLLKLIITAAGTFIFKQIKPIERRRVVGILEEEETGEFRVLADNRRWRVLNASVSYFKGEAGDEAVIVVPREGFARWGAVENIIKR